MYSLVGLATLGGAPPWNATQAIDQIITMMNTITWTCENTHKK